MMATSLTKDFLQQTAALELELESTDDPTFQRIESLADETGLPLAHVFMWFHGKRAKKAESSKSSNSNLVNNRVVLASSNNPGPKLPSTAQPTSLLDSAPFGDPFVLNAPQWQENVPTESALPIIAQNESDFFNQTLQWCIPEADIYGIDQSAERLPLIMPPKKRARKTSGGLYPCQECGSSFSKDKNWRDHQDRKHFPREIFVCGRKKKGTPCNKLMYRVDNAKKHIASHGADMNCQSLDAEIAKRTVPVRGFYHDACGYGICSLSFGSWEQSMDHIISHMKRMISGDEEVQDWVHRCRKQHVLKAGVHYDLPEIEDSSVSESSDGSYGGSGGSGASSSGNIPSLGFGLFDGSHTEWTRSNMSGYLGPSCFNTHDMTRSTFDSAQNKNLDCCSAALDDSASSSRSPALPKSLRLTKLLRIEGSKEVYAVPEISRSMSAIRLVRWSKDQQNATATKQRIYCEAKILNTLHHPHIVSCLGIYTFHDGFGVLMETGARTTLDQLLRNPGTLASDLKFQARDLLRVMRCLASALCYLHSPREGEGPMICHINLEPQNILICPSRGPQIHLADFWVSEPSKESSPSHILLASKIIQKTSSGTSKYGAPEIHNALEACQPFAASPICDIWSLSCVFSEIITWIMYGPQGLEVFEAFRAGDQPNMPYCRTPEKIQEWLVRLEQRQDSQDGDLLDGIIFNIIKQMLNEKSRDRPTALQVWLELSGHKSFNDPNVSGKAKGHERPVEDATRSRGHTCHRAQHSEPSLPLQLSGSDKSQERFSQHRSKQTLLQAQETNPPTTEESSSGKDSSNDKESLGRESHIACDMSESRQSPGEAPDEKIKNGLSELLEICARRAGSDNRTLTSGPNMEQKHPRVGNGSQGSSKSCRSEYMNSNTKSGGIRSPSRPVTVHEGGNTSRSSESRTKNMDTRKRY